MTSIQPNGIIGIKLNRIEIKRKEASSIFYFIYKMTQTCFVLISTIQKNVIHKRFKSAVHNISCVNMSQSCFTLAALPKEDY